MVIGSTSIQCYTNNYSSLWLTQWIFSLIGYVVFHVELDNFMSSLQRQKVIYPNSILCICRVLYDAYIPTSSCATAVNMQWQFHFETVFGNIYRHLLLSNNLTQKYASIVARWHMIQYMVYYTPLKSQMEASGCWLF